MNTMLIINPIAGKVKAKTNLMKIINELYTNGHTVTVFPTQKQGDATEIVEKNGHDFDLVVCAGGDGTLNEVVYGIMRLEKKQNLDIYLLEQPTILLLV